MNDDIVDKDKITNDASGNVSLEENKLQSEGEKSVSHEVIHKKDGRLHIYIRQDKYKGELKSKNWVGRAYVSGKQTIYSSRTTVLEEAIPILEKWFDEITNNKILEANINKNTELDSNKKNLDSNKKNKVDEKINQTEEGNVNQINTQLQLAKSENTGLTSSMFDKLKNIKLDKFLKSKKSDEEGSSSSGVMDKIKNIKFDQLLKSKKTEDGSNVSSGVVDKLKKIKLGGLLKSKESTSGGATNKKDALSLIKKIFKSKVSKVSVAGEEIAGLDITRDGIRVSQISGNKDSGFILDKYFYHPLDQSKFSENILESKEYISEEIQVALANAKVTTSNVAISIPVSSAIIRVVSSPLITDKELEKAIETDSLWENLVQLGENLNEYSIFHQVIKRDEKLQTMEILFVASKLTDINSYSSIVKKCGLNPVIVDVRCFTLKNSFDNSIFKNIEAKNDSTILEIGADENYLMVIHNDTPIITDIFLRQPEKDLLTTVGQTSEDNSESQAVIRRYAMQLKQALSDYEGKYDHKVNNIQVISTLDNIESIIPEFKKNIPTLGFKLFNPLENVTVPVYLSDKVESKNTSPLASVMGLAFRKLDIFGYYKFVTAVKNINLLPNREALKKTAKLKFLSGFAAKGLASAIAGIYIIMSVYSYFQIQSNKSELLNFDNVQLEYDTLSEQYSKYSNKLMQMKLALELGKFVNSNQINTYRALAQVARSVPARVQFTKMAFDGEDVIKIEGRAFSDQDILNFINNLNAKKLVAQASLLTMKVEQQSEGENNLNKKGFEINCVIILDS